MLVTSFALKTALVTKIADSATNIFPRQHPSPTSMLLITSTALGTNIRNQHIDYISLTTVVSLSQSETHRINPLKNLVLLIPCIWIALQPQILFQKCSYQEGWKTIGNLIASLVSFLALRIKWYKISQIGTNKIDRAAVSSNTRDWFQAVCYCM